MSKPTKRKPPKLSLEAVRQRVAAENKRHEKAIDELRRRCPHEWNKLPVPSGTIWNDCQICGLCKYGWKIEP